MGLFDGMKEKLGFGEQPEWQDDYYPEDESFDEPYDEDFPADEGYADSGSVYGSVASFNNYDPSTFEHVSVSAGRSPKAASTGYASDSYFAHKMAGTSPYSSGGSRQSSRDNVRSFNDRAKSDSTSSASAWGTPADPSFLDKPVPKRSHDISSITATSSSNDPYSQFDSDLRQLHDDPAARIEIVKPIAYADVEKIASAVKASKTVVLVLRNTKVDLAKRILDFSFGVACGLDGTVDKLADRVFVISKSSSQLSSQAMDYLRKQGVVG